MRKLIVLLSLAVSLALLASCSLLPGKPSNTPEASPAPSATGDNPAETPSPDGAVKTFLESEPDAPAVAAYLKDNTASLTAADADLLVERLVLLHQDISQDMNMRIWEDGFMTALNETLGGTLDAAKIGAIEDPVVKSAFQVASDAGMTIVRYEETPAFEPTGVPWLQSRRLSAAIWPLWWNIRAGCKADIIMAIRFLICWRRILQIPKSC